MCAQGLCKDAKPTKHTQTLTLRKARCDSADAKQAHTDVVVTKGERDGAKQGVVRFWKEWCSNPSGSRPNSFGRQHLTFDKGGKGGGARRGDYCSFVMIVGIERFDATGGASPSPYEKRVG